MAKRTYRSISSYLSFRYFSRINNDKWKSEYKRRTGRATARGWQFSPEYAKFQDSQRNRVMTFAERNPESFFEKRDYILKRSNQDEFAEYEFSDRPTPGAELLSPMSGRNNWGVARLIDAAKQRAAADGKKLTVITRITAKDLLEESAIATNKEQAMNIRSELMRNYGQEIAAGQDKGTYELIGANYIVEYFSTGSQMLAIIDVELFLY